MPLALRFPAWLKPEIISGLPIRWYGLMYLLAFLVAYRLFKFQARRQNLAWTDDQITGFFFWAIFGLLIGARIFATIVYDTSGLYLRRPWLIFWPFAGGQFVGLQGMSYHGGLIGTIIAISLYCRKHQLAFFEASDMLSAGVPLGYTFGRLGNFINGELYGRVTAAPIGMIFPNAPAFPLKEAWVKDIADRAGLVYSIHDSYINLPRHPSQLYEALFEGIVLWVVLWILIKRQPFKGFISGAYVAGYGLVRFFIEYFREPDLELGYRIQFVKTNLPAAVFSSPFNFTTGQILCFLMVIGGGGLILGCGLANRKTSPTSPAQTSVKDAGKASPSEISKARRKLRKKLAR